MRVLIVLLLILAGCADVAEEPQSAEPVEHRAEGSVRPIEGERRAVDPIVVELDELTYGGLRVAGINEEIVFTGTLEVGDAAACGGACHVLDVEFDVPEQYQDGWIDIRVYWDGTDNAGFDLDVGDVRRGHDVSRAMVWGEREASVAIAGVGEYAGSAVYRHADLAVVEDELRPNLVTLTPIELYIDGCKPEERTEDGASRCLRLGNAVGNVGDGPLEVHLDAANGALAAGGLGEFVQRIYTPGGYEDRPASGAELHMVHGHFHYAGLAHFALHDFDEETGLRGAEVATGVKRGFCFLDWGDMNTPEAPSEGGQRAEQDCLVPNPGGWSMGVSRGYYDYYWPELADQYIDIAGVPDGVYELVSIADGADTLAETDETDNSASLLVRITGDNVEIVEIRSLYDNPEDPSVTP